VLCRRNGCSNLRHNPVPVPVHQFSTTSRSTKLRIESGRDSRTPSEPDAFVAHRLRRLIPRLMSSASRPMIFATARSSPETNRVHHVRCAAMTSRSRLRARVFAVSSGRSSGDRCQRGSLGRQAPDPFAAGYSSAASSTLRIRRKSSGVTVSRDRGSRMHGTRHAFIGSAENSGCPPSDVRNAHKANALTTTTTTRELSPYHAPKSFVSRP
jgi:hypothetical protein